MKSEGLLVWGILEDGRGRGGGVWKKGGAERARCARGLRATFNFYFF